MRSILALLPAFFTVCALGTFTASAQDVALDVGPSGTWTASHSFNETRGVDVTVNASGFPMVSMTLRGLSISSPSATVGARVYQHATMVLLASADTTVAMGDDQNVTIPLSYMLVGGGRYRLCFYVAAGGFGGSGVLFDPAPAGSGGLPYTESTGRFLVTQAHLAQPDVYPTSGAISMPLITLGSAVQPFCFGNDSGTDCPCSPSVGGSVLPGAAGNGCPNSAFAGGANLAAAGAPSVSGDSLVLLGTALPNSPGLYFQGNAAIGVGPTSGSVFGDGLRCVNTNIVRLKTVMSASSTSSYPQAGDPSISVRGGVVAPGTRYYQLWYRNAAVFCTATTFNLTNGLGVTWGA